MSTAIGLQALGLVTPLGQGKAAVCDALYQGKRNGLVHRNDLIDGRSVYVGAVTSLLPEVPTHLKGYGSHNNRMMLAALREIEEDVALAREKYGASRIAVILGTSTSGIAETEHAYDVYRQTGCWPETYSYSQHEAGSLAEFAAQYLNLTGPAYSIATACSSSSKVFGSARRLIQAGICDAAIIGGADSLCRMTLNGFNSLGAVSAALCNPFSANRDGINIGEGAIAFLMAREEAAVDLLGVGETSDAYHISAPRPDGAGAIEAMSGALEDAGIDGSTLAYLNLHGTGTDLNDSMESQAVKSLFGTALPCSSTKGMTGHMLGAAGAAEAAFLWLSLHPEFGNGLLPPHVWDSAADPEIAEIELVQVGTRVDLTKGAAMLSNSFAFGGNNVSLLLGLGGTA